jgi:phosphoadenosine phosphosulfate reductase
LKGERDTRPHKGRVLCFFDLFKDLSNPYDVYKESVGIGVVGVGVMSKQLSVEEIANANRELAGATPQEILRWAATAFHPRLLMATAFGAEGCCVIHMLAEIEPRVTFINLETGYQFPETLDLRERINARYGIEVQYIRPELSVDEYEREHGGPLYGHRPDQCCHDRKILPLQQALALHAPRAWISAIRKNQTADRNQADVLQWDVKFSLFKVNPQCPTTRSTIGITRASVAGRARGPSLMEKTIARAAGRVRSRRNADCT